MSFSTEQLIELVKQNECIYNKYDKQHRNRVVIEKVWSEIAQEMGFEGRVCREKWSNLRSNYNRELRKLRQQKGDGSFKTTWPYFHVLSFLLPHSNLRSQTGAAVKEYNDDESKSSLPCTEDEEEPIEVTPEIHVYPPQSTPSLASRKRKLPFDSSDFNGSSYNSSNTQIFDDDTHFLLSLRTSMKKLNADDNMSFRIEVQQLLQKYLRTTSMMSLKTEPC